jgi:hypothetical protein
MWYSPGEEPSLNDQDAGQSRRCVRGVGARLRLKPCRKSHSKIGRQGEVMQMWNQLRNQRHTLGLAVESKLDVENGFEQ